MKKSRTFRLLIALIVVNLAFFACRDKEDEQELLRQSVLTNYANIVYASYEDSYDAASMLRTTINTFLANPTAVGYQSCKDAWLAARIPYGQTEAYRFYSGPIDDEDGPEGLINAWPMDENFIDYVQGDASAGLINNPTQYPNITKEILILLNESISEESIFTGYHAIEFLLWGQDFSTSEAGKRPYTDYVTGPGGTGSNQARRGQYLKVVSELLLDHLAEVRDEWKEGAPYRTKFLNSTQTKVALGYLITSLGSLSKGELSGERMFVAIDTKDQENEHSCFSDNTINDIKLNFLGLKNVYFGSYKRIDGSTISGNSINMLAEQSDKAKADVAKASFESAEAAILTIPNPFDKTIVENPTAVVPSITALRTLSDRIADVGFSVGAEF